jgi:transcriptional regulator with XRE-family HTH domain
MTGKKIDIGPAGAQLAKNIRTVRTARRLQYKELSDLMESLGRPIAPLGIRRIESHERRVDVQDLVTLSEALGFSVDDLVFSDIEVHAEYKLIKA